MSDRLRYGFAECKNNRELGPLYVDVPAPLAQRVDTAFAGEDTFPEFSPYKLEASDGGGMRMTILARRIGLLSDEGRRKSTSRVIDVLSTIDGMAYREEDDPRIRIESWAGKLGTSNRLGLNINVKCPDVSDSVASDVGTLAMRQVAKALGYIRRPDHSKRSYNRLVDELVYANMSRPQRLLLQTNEVGSCSVEAGPEDYDAATDRFDAGMHNLYTHDQQLICIAGGVAVAYADELAHKLA